MGVRAAHGAQPILNPAAEAGLPSPGGALLAERRPLLTGTFRPAGSRWGRVGRLPSASVQRQPRPPEPRHGGGEQGRGEPEEDGRGDELALR